MTIEISDRILENTSLQAADIKLEFAVFLFEKNILTLEQASELADTDCMSMLKELGKRSIFIHYDDEELEKDLVTLRKLNRI